MTDLRIYTLISTTSLLAAYATSPRAFRHPYLLLSSILVASSGLADFVLRPAESKSLTSIKQTENKRRRGLESSYEVLGDSSEGEATPSEGEEEINGEEIRKSMEGFRMAQALRAGLAGVGFAISVVGIWGDGF